MDADLAGPVRRPVPHRAGGGHPAARAVGTAAGHPAGAERGTGLGPHHRGHPGQQRGLGRQLVAGPLSHPLPGPSLVPLLAGVLAQGRRLVPPLRPLDPAVQLDARHRRSPDPGGRYLARAPALFPTSGGAGQTGPLSGGGLYNKNYLRLKLQDDRFSVFLSLDIQIKKLYRLTYNNLFNNFN